MNKIEKITLWVAFTIWNAMIIGICLNAVHDQKEKGYTKGFSAGQDTAMSVVLQSNPSMVRNTIGACYSYKYIDLVSKDTIVLHSDLRQIEVATIARYCSPNQMNLKLLDRKYEYDIAH